VSRRDSVRFGCFTPLEDIEKEARMRYIMLALIVILLSKTMPVVELGDKTGAAEGVPVEAQSSVAVLHSVEVDDLMGITFSSFQLPLRDPVKSVLEPASRPVSLGSPPPRLHVALLGNTVARSISSSVEVPTDASPVAENMVALFADEPVLTATISTAQPKATSDSENLWAVSASVLNVRVGPSSKNPVAGTLTRGEHAVVIGDVQNGWVPVRSRAAELEGWVFSRYLVPVEGT